VRILKSFTVFVALYFSVVAGAETGQDDAFFRELVQTKYVKPFRTGDIDRWITAFHPEAIAMHNHRPIDRGRKSIEAFGHMVHQYFLLKEYEVTVTDIRHSDQWVYTVGKYSNHFVSREDGSSPFGRTEGKFVLLWELQPGGEWQIILDMGNSNE
jgi:ketosteroid isomerase-like protein